MIVAAECPEGTGPLKVVNEDLELGVRRYLPAGATGAARVRDGRGDGASHVRDLRAGPRDRPERAPAPSSGAWTGASSCCRTQGTVPARSGLRGFDQHAFRQLTAGPLPRASP